MGNRDLGGKESVGWELGSIKVRAPGDMRETEAGLNFRWGGANRTGAGPHQGQESAELNEPICSWGI